jgi:hypothetical protein
MLKDKKQVLRQILHTISKTQPNSLRPTLPDQPACRAFGMK